MPDSETEGTYCIYRRGSERSSKRDWDIRYWYVLPMYLADRECSIAVSDEDVEEYIGIINQIAQEHPILVDKYLMGKEIEVDAVCDGEDILIPGIMEHIERAGIHSGDSISVYPAQTISENAKETIAEYTKTPGKSTACYRYDQHSVYRTAAKKCM